MDKRRLLELAGMQLNEAGVEHSGTRSLEEFNKMSKKYEAYMEQGGDGELHIVVYDKSRNMIGSWDDFDAMLETGVGDH